MGIGLFTSSKRAYVSPAESKIEVPIVEKRTGQVVSLSPNSVQIMDLETFEVFEDALPAEEEIKNKLQAGVEVEYWKVLGRNKLVRVK